MLLVGESPSSSLTMIDGIMLSFSDFLERVRDENDSLKSLYKKITRWFWSWKVLDWKSKNNLNLKTENEYTLKAGNFVFLYSVIICSLRTLNDWIKKRDEGLLLLAGETRSGNLCAVLAKSSSTLSKMIFMQSQSNESLKRVCPWHHSRPVGRARLDLVVLWQQDNLTIWWRWELVNWCWGQRMIVSRWWFQRCQRLLLILRAEGEFV
jgi:hypothetical protein